MLKSWVSLVASERKCVRRDEILRRMEIEGYFGRGWCDNGGRNCRV